MFFLSSLIPCLSFYSTTLLREGLRIYEKTFLSTLYSHFLCGRLPTLFLIFFIVLFFFFVSCCFKTAFFVDRIFNSLLVAFDWLLILDGSCVIIKNSKKSLITFFLTRSLTRLLIIFSLLSLEFLNWDLQLFHLFRAP